MKILLKYKVVLASFVMALVLTVMGTTAEAKTFTYKIDGGEYEVSVGYETDVSGNDIKLNGKSLSKMKKKVKSVKTDESNGNYYFTKGYYYLGYSYDSAAYKSGATYEDARKYVKDYTYECRFLKTGKYKISATEYDDEVDGWREVYQMKYDHYDYPTDTDYYKLMQLTYSKENGWEYQQVGTELYVSKRTSGDEYYSNLTYYEGVTSKALYGQGSNGFTPISFKKGADGKLHKYCEPIVTKVITTTTYDVGSGAPEVLSVQLGKSKFAYSAKNTAYSRSNSTTVKKFLSGNSGKLTVKLDKKYKLVDIVVKTYNKDGQAEYQLVKNNSKVNYGNYKYLYSSENAAGTYKYSTTRLFKETQVYLLYTTKKAGSDYYDITNIELDEDGDYKFSYVHYYSDGSKYEGISWNSVPDYDALYTFYKK